MSSAVGEARRLRDLAGIGRAMEADLHRLNIHSVAELAAAGGHELYERLSQLVGVQQDPCVLDTLRCAVAQAQNPDLPLEQRNWWWWSRQRKAVGQ